MLLLICRFAMASIFVAATTIARQLVMPVTVRLDIKDRVLLQLLPKPVLISATRLALNNGSARVQQFHLASHTDYGDYVIDTHDHDVVHAV